MSRSEFKEDLVYGIVFLFAWNRIFIGKHVLTIRFEEGILKTKIKIPIQPLFILFDIILLWECHTSQLKKFHKFS